MQKLLSRIPPHLLHCLPAIVLILLGVLAATLAGGYRFGSLTAMGPGYFPLMLGLALIFLSLITIRLSRLDPAPEDIVPWRPLLAVATGMLAWALLVESLGFIPASALQIALSALALERPALRSLAALILALCIIGYFIFIDQLGVPLAAFGN